MKHLSQLAIAASIFATFMIQNSASGFECRGAKLPSSIVICSDPELISLADERQQAFNEVRWGKNGDDLLDPDRDKELWLNQRAWVRDYATSCGVPSDRSPKLPISGSI